jgi:hypothetical protein
MKYVKFVDTRKNTSPGIPPQSPCVLQGDIRVLTDLNDVN